MESNRFDALTRGIAAAQTRRQLIRALGGGFFAALGGLAGNERGAAASCPSGVVCSAHCCPHASDICLAGQCVSCPSGIVCSTQCCAAGERCVAGRCQGALTAPNPGPCQPATACPPGQTCGTSDDGCGGTLTCGTCDAPYVCNTYDNPPPNCVCEDFQTVCDGKCGQFNDSCGNPVDCGGCDSGCCGTDNRCYVPNCTGEGCGGACIESGPAPWTCCNGTCVNVDDDPANCSGCGHRCKDHGSSGVYTCDSGVCHFVGCQQGAPLCANNTLCCNVGDLCLHPDGATDFCCPQAQWCGGISTKCCPGGTVCDTQLNCCAPGDINGYGVCNS